MRIDKNTYGVERKIYITQSEFAVGGSELHREDWDCIERIGIALRGYELH